MKVVKIKDHVIEIPIIQGAMGVGVSKRGLASAVINAGAVGSISAAQIGYEKSYFSDSIQESYRANVEALKEEIKAVQEKTNNIGFLCVNILTAHRQYGQLAAAAVQAKANAIVSGAGLPMDLPKYTKGTDTAAIPIVSSVRGLNIILKKWKRKYDVIPDAIIIEGPKAGGHLGVSYDEIGSNEVDDLDNRLIKILQYLHTADLEIPVFVAGGVYTAADVKHYQSLGAAGVQLATRFIATKECDADQAFKDKIISAQAEDIVSVKSPVGYPARAVRNSFTEELEKHNIPVKQCLGCVIPCSGKVSSTVYCISERLIMSVNGDTDYGLVFCGTNASRVNQMTTVQKLIDELSLGLGGNNE